MFINHFNLSYLSFVWELTTETKKISSMIKKNSTPRVQIISQLKQSTKISISRYPAIIIRIIFMFQEIESDAFGVISSFYKSKRKLHQYKIRVAATPTPFHWLNNPMLFILFLYDLVKASTVRWFQFPS